MTFAQGNPNPNSKFELKFELFSDKFVLGWSGHWLNDSIELGTKVNEHRPGWMLCRPKTLFHCIPVP
jgi:hypothetical protein